MSLCSQQVDFRVRAGRVRGVTRSARLSVGLLIAAALLTVGVEVKADRVSCAEVVKAIDAVTSRRGKHRADPVRLAHRLGVEPAWVTHCAQLYGRRLAKGLPPMGDEEREALQERWESEESVEVEREDAVQGPLEVLDKQRELRSTPTPNIEEERHQLEGENPPR